MLFGYHERVKGVQRYSRIDNAPPGSPSHPHYIPPKKDTHIQVVGLCACKRDSADVIKALRQDYLLGLSRLAQYNHKGPFQRDKGSKAQKDVMMGGEVRKG